MCRLFFRIFNSLPVAPVDLQNFEQRTIMSLSAGQAGLETQSSNHPGLLILHAVRSQHFKAAELSQPIGSVDSESTRLETRKAQAQRLSKY
jgi:hypothetical protein